MSPKEDLPSEVDSEKVSSSEPLPRNQIRPKRLRVRILGKKRTASFFSARTVKNSQAQKRTRTMM